MSSLNLKINNTYFELVMFVSRNFVKFMNSVLIVDVNDRKLKVLILNELLYFFLEICPNK